MLSEHHTDRLVRTLLRQDASVVGLRLDDPDDLVSAATISASSTRTRIEQETATDRWDLDADLGIVIPVDPELATVDFLVDARSGTELAVEVYDPVVGQNYVPERFVTADAVQLAAGDKQWVRLRLPFAPEESGNAFVLVRANADVSVYVSDEPLPGVLCFLRVPLPDDAQEPSREWSARSLSRQSVCLRVAPETAAFAPAEVADGVSRPFAGPHEWVSDPSAPRSRHPHRGPGLRR
ncbi:MAG TPA: hypothetical protein VIM10_04065 [Actinopolymorphaceae bacterium]|jgi:hypothetical protein